MESVGRVTRSRAKAMAGSTPLDTKKSPKQKTTTNRKGQSKAAVDADATCPRAELFKDDTDATQRDDATSDLVDERSLDQLPTSSTDIQTPAADEAPMDTMDSETAFEEALAADVNFTEDPSPAATELVCGLSPIAETSQNSPLGAIISAASIDNTMPAMQTSFEFLPKPASTFYQSPAPFAASTPLDLSMQPPPLTNLSMSPAPDMLSLTPIPFSSGAHSGLDNSSPLMFPASTPLTQQNTPTLNPPSSPYPAKQEAAELSALTCQQAPDDLNNQFELTAEEMCELEGNEDGGNEDLDKQILRLEEGIAELAEQLEVADEVQEQASDNMEEEEVEAEAEAELQLEDTVQMAEDQALDQDEVNLGQDDVDAEPSWDNSVFEAAAEGSLAAEAEAMDDVMAEDIAFPDADAAQDVTPAPSPYSFGSPFPITKPAVEQADVTETQLAAPSPAPATTKPNLGTPKSVGLPLRAKGLATAKTPLTALRSAGSKTMSVTNKAVAAASAAIPVAQPRTTTPAATPAAVATAAVTPMTTKPAVTPSRTGPQRVPIATPTAASDTPTATKPATATPAAAKATPGAAKSSYQEVESRYMKTPVAAAVPKAAVLATPAADTAVPAAVAATAKSSKRVAMVASATPTVPKTAGPARHIVRTPYPKSAGRDAVPEQETAAPTPTRSDAMPVPSTEAATATAMPEDTDMGDASQACMGVMEAQSAGRLHTATEEQVAKVVMPVPQAAKAKDPARMQKAHERLQAIHAAEQAPVPKVASAVAASVPSYMAPTVANKVKAKVPNKVVAPDYDPRSLRELKRQVKEQAELKKAQTEAAAKVYSMGEVRSTKAAKVVEAELPLDCDDGEEEAEYDEACEGELVGAMDELKIRKQGPWGVALRGVPLPAGRHTRFDDAGTGVESPGARRLVLRGVPASTGQYKRWS